MKKIHIFLFFCLCILVYIVFAVFSISEFPIGDAFGQLAGAKVHNNRALESNFNRLLILSNLPFYVSILSLIDNFFYFNQITARIVGIISFIITAILLYAVSLKVFKNDKDKYLIGILGVFFYSINPMVIQGSLLTDIDTTILLPFLLLFVYIFIALGDTHNKAKYYILGTFFGFILWVKHTTPLALIPAIFIFYFLNRKFKEAIKASLSVLLIGLSLFIISLGIYCYFTKKLFIAPFFHIKESMLGTSTFMLNSYFKSSILNIARIILRIILFVTPFYFLVYILGSVTRLRKIILEKRLNDVDFLLILSFIIFFSYLFVGGITYSFPKYHYPFISLMTIINAFFMLKKLKFNKRFLLWLLPSLGVIVIYNIVLVGDLLYLSDYAIRESLIKTGTIVNKIAMQLLLSAILYILPFVLLLLIFKIKNKALAIYRTIFIWIVASCLSLNILQAKADYHTIYCYGGRGTKEAISFLKKINLKTSHILATQDISFNINQERYLREPNYQLLNRYCLDPKKFIWFITDREADCIAFSISSNTVEQYLKVFHHSLVINFLEKDFKKKEIGSYTIWVRKDLAEQK